VEDIEPLSGMPLVTLWMTGSAVRNIDAVKTLSSLKHQDVTDMDLSACLDPDVPKPISSSYEKRENIRYDDPQNRRDPESGLVYRNYQEIVYKVLLDYENFAA